MIATAESLGSAEFKARYGLRYAYLSGAMYKGIASAELVVAMGRAGMMGYLGTGGLRLERIDTAISAIRAKLAPIQAYGSNFLSNHDQPEQEKALADLLLKHGVRNIEAAAFTRITPSLVRLRLSGVRRAPNGRIERSIRVLAKVSRPEIAALFMQPAPVQLVRELAAAGEISALEAELAQSIPMADEICVEADSGGHTDQGVAYVLLPFMLALRDEICARHRYDEPILIGAAGGIGTPQAAAAAFILGAQFIVTGSINQCTVEAGTSDVVKDLLQELSVQDTAYAPAGDMFEIGARIQVAKRGLFFPARANKLYELYQRHGSLDEIDVKTRQQIEERFFKRSFAEVWAETSAHYSRVDPARLAEAHGNPKKKMALIFRWYFIHTTRLALRGTHEQKVDFQVHCGPAMGAFNRWVKGTRLENWRNRSAPDIGLQIMNGAAEVLNQRLGVTVANTSLTRARASVAYNN